MSSDGPSCSPDTIVSRMAIGPIQLLKHASPGQRRTLLAAALGWMLDGFDPMLYALALAHVMRDLDMSKHCGRMLSTARGRGARATRPDNSSVTWSGP
jgi:hypothetical protein